MEKALANLREVINAPYDIYTKMRASDFDMDDFEVDGKTYKIALFLTKISIKITKMLRFVKKPSALFKRSP